MVVSYDEFTAAFLSKITEYRFLKLDHDDRQELCDGYIKRSWSKFREVIDIDGIERNDAERNIMIPGIDQDNVDEIIEIISDGMVYQWMSQHMHKQENLENMLTTSDFSAYSPAELTHRITNAYEKCRNRFINEVREYSYRHGDLSGLHL